MNMQHQAGIVAKQLLGDVPLRTGEYATLEDTQTVLEGLDTATARALHRAVFYAESNCTNDRRTAILRLLSERAFGSAATS